MQLRMLLETSKYDIGMWASKRDDNEEVWMQD